MQLGREGARGPWVALLVSAAVLACLCLGSLLWRPPSVGWKGRGSLAPEGVEPVRVSLGQLYVSGISGTDLDEETKDALVRGQLAGVVLTSRNIVDKDQVRRLCRTIAQAVPEGDPPPILCVEQEGGDVSRLSGLGVPDWGGAKYLKRHGADGIRGYATQMGQFLSGLYLNANLAPVLDVRVDPRNPLTETRSFGADPAEVAKLAGAFADGLRGAKVKPVGKYFPGRGAATRSGDSARYTVSADAEALKQTHIAPFTELMKSGLDAVMVPHITYTAWDKSHPASRSAKVVTDLLRGQLGFQGVVWSEDISGKAFVDGETTIEDGAVEVLAAGVDIILDTRPWASASQTQIGLRRAAATGKLDQERLAAAVERVRAWRATLTDPAP